MGVLLTLAPGDEVELCPGAELTECVVVRVLDRAAAPIIDVDEILTLVGVGRGLQIRPLRIADGVFLGVQTGGEGEPRAPVPLPRTLAPLEDDPRVTFGPPADDARELAHDAARPYGPALVLWVGRRIDGGDVARLLDAFGDVEIVVARDG